MIRHEYLLHTGSQSYEVELIEKMGDVGGNKKRHGVLRVEKNVIEP